MKKIKSLLFYSTIAAFALTSCTDDDPVTPAGNGNNDDHVVKTGEITADETWTADNIYQLSGRVVVTEGATLNIEPGTIIKAEGGREANASALIIARGAKIMAEGTPQEPIIFTSVMDEVEDASEIESPNLDETFAGLWGGVMIMGKAPISADATEKQIEGIPPSDANGLYGGTEADDNSGVMRYVSIRHGGTLIGEGNEINGLTLGGVGSGTTIEYIEVVANLDDGIEWFGGTVNVSNTMVWAVGDDSYDVDQAYSGTITNFIAIHGSETDHALEIDGPEGSMTAGFTMQDGSLIGWNDQGLGGGEYADFRDEAMGTLSNLYWADFSESSDVELDDDGTSDNYKAGSLQFNDWSFNVDHLSGGNSDLADIFVDQSNNADAFSDLSFAQIVTTPTGGADKSVFSGWTWASRSAASY